MAQNPTAPPAPEPAAAGHLPPEQFHRWYGGWDPLTPATIGNFMEGFDRPWWIIGGWSLEVFTGIGRDHEDMDISILSSDAGAFREFLGDRWTPWNVDDGWFRPFDQRFTDVRPDSQVWVRRDAQSRGSSTCRSPPTPTAAGPTSATSTTPRTSTTSRGSHRTGCGTPGRR